MKVFGKFNLRAHLGLDLLDVVIKAERTPKTQEIVNFFNDKYIVCIDDKYFSFLIDVINLEHPELDTWRSALSRSPFNTKNNVFTVNSDSLKKFITIDKPVTIENYLNIIKESFDNNRIEIEKIFETSSDVYVLE